MATAKRTPREPARPPAEGDCRFPACEEAAVTPAGMCQVHHRVVVSSTGSWLEAG